MLGRTETRVIVNSSENTGDYKRRGWNAGEHLEARHDVTSILKVG